ncbi:sulfotransferase family 2 domain-containing protein [Comamonas antarctica]|uniref:Sulfotransferase family 2 domain-containing protein n=1 Tax=Comamonas antarctica TaxID=2743470 RepID=A0A6N1X918_9BURK|nr:sulfotransferase family 2 domain-containing protein [Comamonas antarctica]QKV54843.1 sulfotransferase family 2 domain-containing protein [Comamonas antarctica]
MTFRKKAYSGRLIFDHLPKTAGQAINAWLISELGTGCVTPNLIGEHSDLIRNYGGAYSVISAHVHFQYGETLDPRYQYITLFRDPIDRIVSWLYFVVNNHTDAQLPFLRKACLEFINNGDISLNPRISNGYVEHFSRIGGISDESDEKKIEHAFSVIKQYDVVGLYDNIPGFLSDTATLIGVSAPEKLKGVNITKQRPQMNELSSDMRERIVALNRLDIRLFEMVVAWKNSPDVEEPPQNESLIKYQLTKHERKHYRNTSTVDLRISSATVREGGEFTPGQLMTFDIDISLNREMTNFEIGIHIFDSVGNKAFETTSTALGHSYPLMGAGYYRISHYVIADLPIGKYTAGLSFSERLPQGLKDVFWQDVLYGFDVVHPKDNMFSGHSYLPAALSVAKTKNALVPTIVSNHAGFLRAINPPEQLTAGESTCIKVEVSNSSDCIWQGDTYLPISFSYHWLKSNGEIFLSNGLRSAIPDGGFKPNTVRTGELRVEAPNETGSFILVLTLVQESVAWFEENGFSAAQHTIEIKEPNA